MKRSFPLAILLSILFGSTSGDVWARISVDYRETTDFSAYHTYSWAPGTAAQREMAEDRIVQAVERELAERGLHRVPSGGDLSVTTHVLVGELTLQQLDDPIHWDFWSGITDVDPFDLGAGTLVIDFVDPDSDDLVWRGLATKTVGPYPDKKLMRKIDKLIGKLLAKFPPER